MTSETKERIRTKACLAKHLLQMATDRIGAVYAAGYFPPEIRDGLQWASFRIHVVAWNMEALDSGDEEAIGERGGWLIAASTAFDLIEGIRAMIRGYVSPPHVWRPISLDCDGTKEKLAEALEILDLAYDPIQHLYHIAHRYNPPRPSEQAE